MGAAVIPTPATIARVLSERGYDFEIAHIFALEARQLGRLASAVSPAEAVAIVADMMTPTGIWAHVPSVPRLPPLGRPYPYNRATSPVDSRRTWLAT